ncbi:hypothetical protein QYE76_004045 [Lolium multiflorum]|uniref:Uncharacterized protein n=1 Tax=Lolium multiflorum TaxID=4521 RepID=A0AAD8VZE5_LOLMU|nr:hypothetical protein QYE76_004045 [Lolium multiflorum]
MERFDSSGSGFSSGSSSSNPFAGPSVAVIRDIPIAERVPLKLSTTAANFFPWKTYFGLLFREYDLLDHVDGTIDLLAMPHDPEWLAIDATIIRWFYQTVSNDIFRTVVRDGDSAHTVWAKITGLFTDNKIQRVTFLQQEFFGTHQNDLSLDDYALKLKSLSDELRDLEFPIDDKIMLSTLSAGLGEDLSNAASNLTLLTTPTFEQAVAYLRLEERRLKHLRAQVSLSPDLISTHHAAAPVGGNRRKHGKRHPGRTLIIDGTHAGNLRFFLMKKNPTKEIFSELDEINAQGLIFPRSFQKTERITKWGDEAPPHQGRAAKGGAAPP